MISEHAAPSVVWEELPAVTEPMAANAGRSLARFSMVVGRTPSSKSWTKVSFTVMPFFSLNLTALTGTISLNLPFFCAWAALAWEWKPNSSCISRVIL